MNREEYLNWVRETFGTEPEYPWDDRNAVLRHSTNRKWFAVVLEVGRDRLELPGEGKTDVVNVKCDPRIAGTLVTQPGFRRAYHMNKEKWISILLDGSAPAEEIRLLTAMSYDLTDVKTKTHRNK